MFLGETAETPNMWGVHRAFSSCTCHSFMPLAVLFHTTFPTKNVGNLQQRDVPTLHYVIIIIIACNLSLHRTS